MESQSVRPVNPEAGARKLVQAAALRFASPAPGAGLTSPVHLVSSGRDGDDRVSPVFTPR